MAKKTFFFASLLSLALGLFAEIRFLQREREQLAAGNRRIERLLAQERSTTKQRDDDLAALRAAQEKLAALQASVAFNEAREAEHKAWLTRIRRLQQRLDEMPAEKIPELKVLSMKDWIEAVLSAETATDEQVRKIFARLRLRARWEFAGKLQEALKHFVDASGGELPSTLHALQPYLPAFVDDEILARYTLLRSGKIGPKDEDLISSQAVEGLTMFIKLNGHRFNGRINVGTPSEVEGVADRLGEMADFTAPLQEKFVNFSHDLETLMSTMNETMSFKDDAFDEHLRAAIRQFRAANPGRSPADLWELHSYFPDADRLVAHMAPVLAKVEYLLDHERLPDSPDQIRPYLNRPDAAARTLHKFKLKLDGEHGEMTFNLE